MRSRGLLLAAAIVGLLAAGLIYLRLANQGDAKTVVVAASDIAAGTAIRADQVKEVPWAAVMTPQGSFQEAGPVIGRIARESLEAGEPILEFSLAKPDAKSGLTSVIREGWRAISVEADEVSGVAGFIMPGSYVDILLSGKDASGAPFSKIVLQYVRVLAVEQDTKTDTTQPRVVRAVTIELSPEQSERLDLARSIGKLSLVLRNEFDKTPSQSRGARPDDLMAGAGSLPAKPESVLASEAKVSSPSTPVATAPAREPAIRSSTVETIRGTREVASQN